MGLACTCTQQQIPEPRPSVLNTRKSIDEHYRILEQLGSGHIGEVFRAEDVQGRQFAVKCISLPRLHFEYKFVKREVQILMEIEHPNIIKIYDIYEDGMNLYIVMELCSSGNLQQRIIANTLQINDTKQIARQCLSALAYMHERGIIHRDIKPENILFDSQGNVKLADFGLARDTRKQSGRMTIVGTPYYVAPEVLRGNYNSKCDIWSLGVCLYQAITGQLPYQGEDIDKQYDLIDSSNADLSLLPVQCRRFISKLLCRKHKNRPEAADLLKDPDIYIRTSASGVLD